MKHRVRALPMFAAAAAIGLATLAQARVVGIVVDDGPRDLAPAAGQTIAYEQLSGRAFGELDPRDPRNALIQDIELAKDADGKVRYVASFVLTKPKDMNQASGLMWHDVPNRGSPTAIGVAERNFGDIGLASAWQGDNAGINANNGTTVRANMLVGGRHWLQLPTARKADGSAVTGRVFGRIVNRLGVDSQPLIVQTNPVPYAPATLDTTQARLVTRLGEYTTGVVTGEAELPSSDWAWGRCSAANPFPGTFDATQPMHICVRGGFDPAKLYMVTYTAKDAYVLGIGFAAFRDLGDFFRNAQADAAGVANPVAQRVTYSITRGNSQSGNYLAARLHMGFNETESGRLLHDGLWPIKFSRHRPTANRKCSSSKAVAQGPAAHVNTGCGPYVCRSTSRAGPADPDQSFDFSFWAP